MKAAYFRPVRESNDHLLAPARGSVTASAVVRKCLLSFMTVLIVASCKKHETTAETTTTGAGDADAGPMTVEAVDAGGPAGQKPSIVALDFITPIFSAMEWPPKDPEKAKEERAGVIRLGYLRRGTQVEVKPNIVKKANCPEGWYELPSGGYVCGKYVTSDPNSKELATAPHAPIAEGGLPYEYGLNLTNGTPMYRRRPLKKERKDLEKGLAIGKTRKKEGATSAEAPAPPAGSVDTPWYLKDHHGQRPQVKIDDIRTNEQGGLVVVRMVRGFYLALDRELSTGSGRFWRNTAGYLAPADHILVHKPTTEFEGVRIGAEGEKRHLPLGWVVSPRAHHYQVEPGDPSRADEKNGRLKRGDPVSRFTIVQLTGKKVSIEERGYFETEEGWWLRDIDAAITRPGPPPKGLQPGEKWIDVNLSTQSLIAFEGDKPVYATIVSTGRHNDKDKAKDHRTIQGEFRIREKHIAATMEDDGASDGPYSIQDVPWIMYFDGSYALHGAFWHSMFGRERSHGCVNMTPHDAKYVFGWSNPRLPEGWHGIRSSKENAGTRVIVHEDPKPAGAPTGSGSTAPAAPSSSKN